MKEHMSRSEAQGCLLVLNLGQILTPLSTQAYTPLLPIYFTEFLGQSAASAGGAFVTMTAAAFLGFGAMGPMLKALSTRNVLLILWICRVISGALHVLGVLLPPGSTLVMPFVYLSRALHGFSLFNLAISGTWAGTHLSVDDRKAPIQGQVSLMMIGIVTGPLFAAAIAGFMPNDALKYALPGILTIIFNSILVFATLAFFSDYDMMVMPGPSGSKPQEMNPKEKITANIVLLNSFMYTWGYLGTLEPTISLDVLSFFGWGAGENWRAWIVFVVTTIFGMSLGIVLPRYTNWMRISVLWWISKIIPFIFIINWADFTKGVGMIQFFVSFAVFDLGNSQGMHVLTYFSQNMPPASQIKYNQLSNALQQLGRAIGPFVATNVFAFAEQAAPGSGPNWTLLLSLTLTSLPLIASVPFMETIYGTWNAKPTTAASGAP